MKNIKLEDEEKEKLLNKLIECVENREYIIEKKEELYANLSTLVKEIECEYSNEIANKIKVCNHDHLTREYRGAAHSVCNLNYKVPRFVLIFFHNFSGYDAHLIVKEFGDDYNDITLIPNNEEKYIAFSKVVKYDGGFRNLKNEVIYSKIELRFLDSYKFLSSSLSELAKNMKRCHFKILRNGLIKLHLKIYLRWKKSIYSNY